MTFSKTPLKGRLVSELSFLAGHWKGTANSDVVEEYWLPEVEGNMACVFRWIKNGEIYIYEIVSLVSKNNEIHMLLRHFDKDFVAWEEKGKPRDFVVTQIEQDQVIFIDSARPDKGHLRYQIIEDHTLKFYDHEPDGSINFSLEFRKVS